MIGITLSLLSNIIHLRAQVLIVSFNCGDLVWDCLAKLVKLGVKVHDTVSQKSHQIGRISLRSVTISGHRSLLALILSTLLLRLLILSLLFSHHDFPDFLRLVIIASIMSILRCKLLVNKAWRISHHFGGSYPCNRRYWRVLLIENGLWLLLRLVPVAERRLVFYDRFRLWVESVTVSGLEGQAAGQAHIWL